jgi:hypothetical protein
LKQQKEKILFEFEKNSDDLITKNELIQAILVKRMSIQLVRSELEKLKEKTKIGEYSFERIEFLLCTGR